MSITKKYVLKLSVVLTTLFVLLLVLVSQSQAQSAEEAYRVEEFDVGERANVEVQTSGGSIRVIGENTNKVRVEMFVRKGRNYVQAGEADLDDWDIEIEQRGNNVKAIADRKDRFGWNSNNNYSISFVVYAPVNTESEAKTSGGSVSFTGLKGNQSGRTSGGSVRAEQVSGDVNLRTSGGSVTIEEVNGNVEAGTSGGSIRVSDVFGNLDIRTSGGSIRLEDVSGNVDASTSGGSITADFRDLGDSVELRTSGGSIRINVPQGAGMDVDLKGSRVQADLENFKGKSSKRKLEGEINGGGTRLKASTLAGTVVLRYS